MQNLLGDHQDSVVARPVLREFGAQTHLDGGNGFTFGLMHGTEKPPERIGPSSACRQLM